MLKVGFKCSHCQKWVAVNQRMATFHRNHCPFCLWSRHVDWEKSGDRKSGCLSEMQPIGLTFKHEGFDKYTSKPRRGELMVVHQCLTCGQIRLNRLAADDDEQIILKIFAESKDPSAETLKMLNELGIKILSETDRSEIETQLFGKSF